MVSSKTRKIISLAISLLVVVISLTGVALGASMPTDVTKMTSYTPGFAGDPGKMARDAGGNFFIADFWGKGIVKLDRNGNKAGFISTLGRPTAVAVVADNKLAVAMSKPQPYVAFYSQSTGQELSQFGTSGPVAYEPYYNPVGITVDEDGYIYVLDSGNIDPSNSTTINIPKIRVYSSAGAYLGKLGKRIASYSASFAGGGFKQPQGIAYERVAKHIVVVDALTSRLQFFSKYLDAGTCYTTDFNNPPTVPTCYQATKLIGGTAGQANTITGQAAKFYNPVDVAFEYNAGALYRIYVAERSRNGIAVLDGVTNYGYLRGYINFPEIKSPSSLFFESWATTGTGVLYTNNAATATAANILPIKIGAAASVTMTMTGVSATSTNSPLTVSGTTNPATAVTCNVNGGTGVPATGTASWSVDLPLVVNSNNYILCQTTSGGASIGADTYYGTPTTTTTVTINQPVANTYFNSSSITISGTSNMANAAIQLESNHDGVLTTVQTDANNNWSAVVNLTTQASHVITATGSKPGTLPSNATVTVVLDSTSPVMANFSFVSDGSTTTNAVQNLDGIILDANLQSITVNGEPVSAAAKVAIGDNTYFSIPVTLVRGSNTITVTATDKAGNSSTPLSRAVTLAPEKPGFTVDLPADNTFKAAVGTESASGTFDSTFTSVDACGTTATLAAPNWSATTPSIGAGFVSCQFIASGGGNTPVNEKRTFNTSGVLVAITSPATDKATKNSSVIISGSVTANAATPQISINGNTAIPVTGYTLETGAFTHTVSSLVEGLNTVTIISNGTTAVRNIIYDSIRPDLSIQPDTKVMPATIHGSIEPSAKISGITAKLNGIEFVIPVSRLTFDQYDQSGTVFWHADLTGIVYDEKSLSVSSMDPAGNTSTVIYDKGIPTGDIDGDGTVRLADALAALRHVAGTDPINPITDSAKFFNGDVGGLINGRVARDGSIDITDSVLILNKAYGLMSF